MYIPLEKPKTNNKQQQLEELLRDCIPSKSAQQSLPESRWAWQLNTSSLRSVTCQA